MPIKEVPAEVFAQILMCDCGGEMQISYENKHEEGMPHLYKCKQCKASVWDKTKYPRFVFKVKRD